MWGSGCRFTLSGNLGGVVFFLFFGRQRTSHQRGYWEKRGESADKNAGGRGERGAQPGRGDQRLETYRAGKWGCKSIQIFFEGGGKSLDGFSFVVGLWEMSKEKTEGLTTKCRLTELARRWERKNGPEESACYVPLP